MPARLKIKRRCAGASQSLIIKMLQLNTEKATPESAENTEIHR